MFKIGTVALLVLGVLVAAIPLTRMSLVQVGGGEVSKEQALTKAQPQVEAPAVKLLNQAPVPVQISNPTSEPKLLVLELANTVVLRGPVTGASVGKAMVEINTISRKLNKTDVIYLVMDTPGGSVTDGADFINFLAGIPQEIRTVTLFAASMGFHIVESNTGKRLITRNGVLMSHRAAVSGMEGQFDGELETRYSLYKREIDDLEATAANRMALSLIDYKAKIKDEFWAHGFESVNTKVADEVIVLRCGASMVGDEVITVQTLFGPVVINFDRCPMVRYPTKIEFGAIKKEAQGFVAATINDMIYNNKKFVRDVIMTNKFQQIFP